MRRRWLGLVALAALGCEGGQPIHELDPSLSRMEKQRRASALGVTSAFANGIVEQVPPPGTRPFGHVIVHPIDRAAIERGRDRFAVFCAPCHGIAGDGASAIALRMTRKPPAFFDPSIANLSRSQIETVIAEGYGLMPSYASKLDENGRAEVAAYVTALRLSRHAVVSELPVGVRDSLTQEAP